jgi:hypothetical protein
MSQPMQQPAEPDGVASSETRGYQRLSSLFRPTGLDNKRCHRCGDAVYHAEKVGPVHDVVFHRKCFKCGVCGQSLSMKNYWTNQADTRDKEVYCGSHAPRVGTAHIDESAIGMKREMKSQKLYSKNKHTREIRRPGTVRLPTYNINAFEIKRALTAPKAHDYPARDGGDKGSQHPVSFDANALFIKGPMDAQQLKDKGYKQKLDKHHYPHYIVSIYFVIVCDLLLHRM